MNEFIPGIMQRFCYDDTPSYGASKMINAINLCSRLRGLFLVLVTVLAAERGLAAEAPIPIKVVVVSMFENGKPTGDDPGEFQFWIERQKLNHELPFPLGEYPLYRNDAGLLAICTGGGITNVINNAAAAAMALHSKGRDQRCQSKPALGGKLDNSTRLCSGRAVMLPSGNIMPP